MGISMLRAVVSPLLATLVINPAGLSQSPTTRRVSVDASGAQADWDSGGSALSADGRFVAFTSTASNLVPNDTNHAADVFVRDLQSGAIVVVSINAAGAPGDGASNAASLSADGRFVAFQSAATNLVVADTNAKNDIFVRDRQNGTLELVSVDSSGAQGNAQSSAPSISAYGRFVAFNSAATNLVAGDTNAIADIFVHDRSSGTTERVSVSTGGAQGSGIPAYSKTYPYVAISGDGRFVAFWSTFTDLVPGDTNNCTDIFVRDRQLGTTERASVATGGIEADNDSRDPSISIDGRFVAFVSSASNLVAGDTNNGEDVFVRDRQSGTTERISIATGGAQGNNLSVTPAIAWSASISTDGRFVSFRSFASNLVAGDTNNTVDIFVRDRVGGTTERMSVSSGGIEGNKASYESAISTDGRIVAFDSYASNLVAGDTNLWTDVFVRERWLLPVEYCTAGMTSNGCTAVIAATANPSVSHANACTVAVASVEGLKSGMLFYGIDNSGFWPVTWAPGSTSLRCVKYPVQRTPVQNSGGTFGACDGSFVLDWNAYQAANPLSLGNPWGVGAKVYVQAWFRDPPAPKSTNLSNAVEMTYLP